MMFKRNLNEFGPYKIGFMELRNQQVASDVL